MSTLLTVGIGISLLRFGFFASASFTCKVAVGFKVGRSCVSRGTREVVEVIAKHIFLCKHNLFWLKQAGTLFLCIEQLSKMKEKRLRKAESVTAVHGSLVWKDNSLLQSTGCLTSIVHMMSLPPSEGGSSSSLSVTICSCLDTSNGRGLKFRRDAILAAIDMHRLYPSVGGNFSLRLRLHNRSCSLAFLQEYRENLS